MEGGTWKSVCTNGLRACLLVLQTLPMSYVRFIRKQGAKELYVWQGIRVRKTCSRRVFCT